MAQTNSELSVSVKNKKDVTVTGVRAVCGFDFDRAVLDCGENSVTVRGDELTLLDLDSGEGLVRLTGKIDEVSFLPERQPFRLGRRK